MPYKIPPTIRTFLGEDQIKVRWRQDVHDLSPALAQISAGRAGLAFPCDKNHECSRPQLHSSPARVRHENHLVLDLQ